MDCRALRRSIADSLEAHAAVGAPPTWVLSNHDVAREVSRYARPQGCASSGTCTTWRICPPTSSSGLRRARAAALLMLALPGGAYVYQGEELGLPEVEHLPSDALQDPTWEQSGHTDAAVTGAASRCHGPAASRRTGSAPPARPRPRGCRNRTPWNGLSVAAETGDPDSMLELYRRALRIRREHPALGDGRLEWRPAPAGALSFAREPGFACIVNLSGRSGPAAWRSGAADLERGALRRRPRAPRHRRVATGHHGRAGA